MMILVTVTGFSACSLLALAAFASKFSEFRYKRRDPALLALLNALALCAVACGMAVLGQVDWVDRWLGISDITTLIAHLLALAWNTAVLVVVILWLKEPAAARTLIRLWFSVIGLMAGVEVTLFVVSASGTESKTFWIGNATHRMGAAYTALYLLVLEITRLAIFRLCWRYSRKASDPWLRRGLRIAALGSAISLIYGPARGVTLLPIQMDRVAWEIGLTLCLTIGIFLLILGLIMPSWALYLSAARRWVRDVRSYRSLYPLWSDVYRAVPHVVLHPPRSLFTNRLIFRNVNYWLYRRVIEIRDGWLVMRSYLDVQAIPDPLAKGELTGEDPQVAIDVTYLRLALRAYTEGGAVNGSPIDDMPNLRHTDDFDSELDWMVRLAKAYARST